MKYEELNEYILYSIMYKGKWIAYSLDDNFIYIKFDSFMVKIPHDKFFIDKRYLHQTTGLIPLFKKEYTEKLKIEWELEYDNSIGYLTKLSNGSLLSATIFNFFENYTGELKCYKADIGKVAIYIDNELTGFIDTVGVKND